MGKELLPFVEFSNKIVKVEEVYENSGSPDLPTWIKINK